MAHAVSPPTSRNAQSENARASRTGEARRAVLPSPTSPEPFPPQHHRLWSAALIAQPLSLPHQAACSTTMVAATRRAQAPSSSLTVKARLVVPRASAGSKVSAGGALGGGPLGAVGSLAKVAGSPSASAPASVPVTARPAKPWKVPAVAAGRCCDAHHVRRRARAFIRPSENLVRTPAGASEVGAPRAARRPRQDVVDVPLIAMAPAASPDRRPSPTGLR
jgi:hypothetical protein